MAPIILLCNGDLTCYFPKINFGGMHIEAMLRFPSTTAKDYNACNSK